MTCLLISINNTWKIFSYFELSICVRFSKAGIELFHDFQSIPINKMNKTPNLRPIKNYTKIYLKNKMN